MLCTTNKTLRHKLTTTDVEMIKKSQIHHATRCSGGRIALALSISANALPPVVWLMTPAFYSHTTFFPPSISTMRARFESVIRV